MIKAVIFDFFGVLVTEGFKQFRETYFGDDEQKERAAIDLINRVDSGLMSGQDFTDQLADLAGITSREVAAHLGNNKPNQPLLGYIRKLKGQYKLGILSNSSENYPAKLLSKDDLELFDDILLSYRFGMVKPQSEIYELAAERLDIKPEEAVFIDDSPGHCDGAARVGMTTIGYKSFSQLQKELDELLAAGSDN